MASSIRCESRLDSRHQDRRQVTFQGFHRFRQSKYFPIHLTKAQFLELVSYVQSGSPQSRSNEPPAGRSQADAGIQRPSGSAPEAGKSCGQKRHYGNALCVPLRPTSSRRTLHNHFLRSHFLHNHQTPSYHPSPSCPRRRLTFLRPCHPSFRLHRREHQ